MSWEELRWQEEDDTMKKGNVMKPPAINCKLNRNVFTNNIIRGVILC